MAIFSTWQMTWLAYASRRSTWAAHDELHQDMHAAMRGHGTAGPASARAVEAGAVIVAAPRGQTTVVLQMPRGNLEAVSHRVLVTALIQSALEVGPGCTCTQKQLCRHFHTASPWTCAFFMLPRMPAVWHSAWHQDAGLGICCFALNIMSACCDKLTANFCPLQH